MSEEYKFEFKHSPSLSAAIVIAFIGLWSTFYLDVHMDLDIGWLLQCLERFIAGGTYSADFYETNPPLSFLIYLPAYPLYSYSPLSAQFSVFIVFMMYIALSNGFLYLCLRRAKYHDTDIVTIITACLIAQTWVAGISFGSKDHLVFTFLLPFCALLYVKTSKKETHLALNIAISIMGAIALAIKPHYALIPMLLLGHRLYIQKSLKPIIFSSDFITPIIFAILYFAFIAVYTPEFFDILTQVRSIYSQDQPFPITQRLHYLMYPAMAILLSFFVPKTDKNETIKKATYFAVALSVACVIPYFIQNKGFHYHAIPFLSFGMVALFLTMFTIGQHYLKQADYGIWLASGLIAMMTLVNITGGKFTFFTTGQFKAQPVIDTIDELAWNKTYAAIDFKSPFTSLPYISPLKHGSRFGQLWPLFGLSEMYRKADSDEDRQIIRDKMSEIVALLSDDLHRYQPGVVVIPQYRDDGSEETNHTFLNFLLAHDHFNDAMTHYTYYSTEPFDTTLATGNRDPDNLTYYDVYVLNKDHSL